MTSPPPRWFGRWWLLGGGAVLGFAAAFLAPGSAGCIYHDTCIKVSSPGHDWCRNVAQAKQWPVGGSFEDAEPVVRPDGGVPRGCRCYNDAEDQILEDEVPASPLLDQGTRLVYRAKARRHELDGVEPGSLAHALGLRTADQLESVNGIVIHDLDSALRAYVVLGEATVLRVRVKRGTQWLDFTYTVVP